MSISATSRVSATTPHPMRRAGDFVVDTDRSVEAPATTERAALTPTDVPLRATPVSSRAGRPDASFLAHLIATAEKMPQTRQLRRADIADVEAAYRAVANQNGSGSPSGRLQRTA